VIVALPVVCHDTASDLRMEADQVVTLAEPEYSGVAGNWFEQFPMTTDADVRRLLSGISSTVCVAN
jgi:putative phosphoribosyl transferase